jgi:hypothetical protein
VWLWKLKMCLIRCLAVRGPWLTWTERDLVHTNCVDWRALATKQQLLTFCCAATELHYWRDCAVQGSFRTVPRLIQVHTLSAITGSTNKECTRLPVTVTPHNLKSSCLDSPWSNFNRHTIFAGKRILWDAEKLSRGPFRLIAHENTRITNCILVLLWTGMSCKLVGITPRSVRLTCVICCRWRSIRVTPLHGVNHQDGMFLRNLGAHF